MKKAIFLMICTLFLSICGCSKKSDLDIFVDKFKSTHPDGFKINNGWYEYTISSIEYDQNQGNKSIQSTKFVGDLIFQSESLSGKINSSDYECSTTTFIQNNSTISIKTEYSKTITNGSNLYRFNQTISDSSVIDQYSEGSESIEDVSFSFAIGTDYNQILRLPELLKNKEKYKRIYVSQQRLDNRQVNILTIEWFSTSDSFQRTVVDEYFFYDYYQPYKIIRTDQSQALKSTSKTYTIKVFQACEQKLLEVPKVFDKVLDATHKEHVNF